MTDLDLLHRTDAFVGDPREDGGETYTPLCMTCLNKIDLYTCKAFPNGIPSGIIMGDLDHSKPIEGDLGIHYVST